MLRLPRKITAKRQSTHAKTRCATYRQPATHGTTLRLTTNVKLTWKHFETLRLKFARTVTAKRRTSKRTWFKQQRKVTKVKRHTAIKHRRHVAVWYAGFPHLPYYAKGRGSRMGKGKTGAKHWYFKGRANHVILHFKHTQRRVNYVFAHKAQQLLPCAVQYRAHPMRYWLNQLYYHAPTLRNLPTLPPLLLANSYRFWWWRLLYLGLLCDETYSRAIEHISRRVLIIPALCMFDKHLSKFMNAQIITTAFETLHNKIYRDNLTTLDIIRLIITTLILAIIIGSIILI